METPYVGTRFRATAVFRSGATTTGTPTATSDVTALVWDPGGTQATYTTDTTAATVTASTATGTYYVDLTPEEAGTWIIGMYSTGTIQAYTQATVRVLPRGG